jgi:lactaldehyde dehydrogenase
MPKVFRCCQRGKQLRKLTAYERAAILFRIADAIEAHNEELGRLLALKTASPSLRPGRKWLLLRISSEVLPRSKRIFGRVMPVDAVRGQERHFAITIRQPWA